MNKEKHITKHAFGLKTRPDDSRSRKSSSWTQQTAHLKGMRNLERSIHSRKSPKKHTTGKMLIKGSAISSHKEDGENTANEVLIWEYNPKHTVQGKLCHGQSKKHTWMGSGLYSQVFIRKIPKGHRTGENAWWTQQAAYLKRVGGNTNKHACGKMPPIET